MTHRDTQDHRPKLRLPVVHGHRTRVIVALIGFLFSLGVPVVVLGAPGLTVDEQTVAPDDPAGLGITGALPGGPLPSDPLPGGPLPGDAVPGNGVPGTGVPGGDGVRGDSASAGPPGIPVPPNLPDGPLGIPGVMLNAYQRAARTLAASQPGCHLSWSVLAGIGKIESGHASGGRVDAAGNTLGPILGPRLDGSLGMAAIPDTDHGVLDGDPVWDRAVGPMQFIPSSWRSWGVGSPNNIYDSTFAAGRYLCAGGADLSDPAQLQAAVFRYNHSAAYVDIVLRWAAAYLTGVVPTPSAPGPVPPGTTGNGGRPIVANGAPLAATVAQPAPLAATPRATTTPSMTTPPATTSSPPPPATTTTLPPPPATPTPPPATTTSPQLTLPPVTTTTAPVTATPLPSPSPTTDPPPTSALPAGP
jgi:hypothetical protein